MGGFINTQYQNMVNSFQSGFKSLLKNPYYLYNNASPTVVTYYLQNLTMSTLDEGSKLSYSYIGPKSPIRYNKIYDMILFDIDKIQLNLNNGETGLEADEISGETFVLPNTIKPSAGDFFVIDHLETKMLFSINSVSIDTMENGSNFYKCNYKLEQFKEEEIQDQVVEEYHLIINNDSGNFSTLIRSDSYDLASLLNETSLKLKGYYKDLFFNHRVQTFTYTFNGKNFYDEYLIEFIKRNSILENDDEYVYITHNTNLNKLFYIQYNDTIYRAFELGKYRGDINTHVRGSYISDITTVFQQRYEDYFSAEYFYNDHIGTTGQYPSVPIIDFRILESIENNVSLEKSFVDEHEPIPDRLYNILYGDIFVKYFNGEDITVEDIEAIDHMRFIDDHYLYYAIPFLIFCIEQYMKKTMETTVN